MPQASIANVTLNSGSSHSTERLRIRAILLVWNMVHRSFFRMLALYALYACRWP
jgi:hypothetical protein